jgi:hypothetical protein
MPTTVSTGFPGTPATLLVSKSANVLAALPKPARVGFADVRNHLASPRLLAALGTDVFAWHGYTQMFLGGRWVSVSPTFDAGTCRRAGVEVLDFDGENDALLQSFDSGAHLWPTSGSTAPSVTSRRASSPQRWSGFTPSPATTASPGLPPPALRGPPRLAAARHDRAWRLAVRSG